MEQVNGFSVKSMTGCTSGIVPRITAEELPDVIKYQTPTKIMFMGEHVLYGRVSLYTPSTNCIDFTSYSGVIWKEIPLDTVWLFSAKNPHSGLPRSLGSSLIINGELFTVVDDSGYGIWVGNKNVVYYAEDIQTLLAIHGYISVG